MATLLASACDEADGEVDVGPEPQVLATTGVAATAVDSRDVYFALTNAREILRAPAGGNVESFVAEACSGDATVGSAVVAAGVLHWACVTATHSTTWSMPVDGGAPSSTGEASGKVDSMAALRERVFASAYVEAKEKTELHEIGNPVPIATLDGEVGNGIVVHDRGVFAWRRKGGSPPSVVQVDLATGTTSDLALTPPNWTIQSLQVDDDGLLRVEESGSIRRLVRRSFVDAGEVEQATIDTDGPVLVTPSEILYGLYDELWRARPDGSGAELVYSRPNDPKSRVIKWLIADAQGDLVWGAVSTSCNDGSQGLCCCKSWWSDWRVVRLAR
jgi:hypothetical protein